MFYIDILKDLFIYFKGEMREKEINSIDLF